MNSRFSSILSKCATAKKPHVTLCCVSTAVCTGCSSFLSAGALQWSWGDDSVSDFGPQFISSCFFWRKKTFDPVCFFFYFSSKFLVSLGKICQWFFPCLFSLQNNSVLDGRKCSFIWWLDGVLSQDRHLFQKWKKLFICCLLLFKGTINTMNMVCMLKICFFWLDGPIQCSWMDSSQQRSPDWWQAARQGSWSFSCFWHRTR